MNRNFKEEIKKHPKRNNLNEKDRRIHFLALLIIVIMLFAVCACDLVPQFCIESLCVKREREREREREPEN